MFQRLLAMINHGSKPVARQCITAGNGLCIKTTHLVNISREEEQCSRVPLPLGAPLPCPEVIPLDLILGFLQPLNSGISGTSF